MSESITPNPLFILHGARKCLELSPKAAFLERQITALEAAVNQNPELAFDLAKTLVETACKTILNDIGSTPDPNWDGPKLLKETVDKLSLVPASQLHRGEIIAGLRKTAGGLQTVIQGLCELRNNAGFASHGQDGFAPQLDAIQATVAARAADTIVHFVFSVHKEYGVTATAKRIRFGEHEEFDEYIDDLNGVVEIFDLQYRPSEVLFRVDDEAYLDKLNEYLAAPEPDDNEAAEPEHSDPVNDAAPVAVAQPLEEPS